jgi:hypothetical protein
MLPNVFQLEQREWFIEEINCSECYGTHNLICGTPFRHKHHWHLFKGINKRTASHLVTSNQFTLQYGKQIMLEKGLEGKLVT